MLPIEIDEGKAEIKARYQYVERYCEERSQRVYALEEKVWGREVTTCVFPIGKGVGKRGHSVSIPSRKRCGEERSQRVSYL